MDKILVAVDGSEHAGEALRTTSILAKQAGTSVVVFHCIGEGPLSKDMQKNIETEYSHELNKRLSSLNLVASLPDETQYAHTMLSQTKKVSQVAHALVGENTIDRAIAYLHQNGVDEASTCLVNGDPADEIIKAYEKYNVDTIVMGFRGRV